MDFFSNLISAGANLLGGLLNRLGSKEIASENIANQRDFAQHGISWRVADAKAAGINPLAALGASTSSFSNVVGDNSFGAGVANAGQDLGRAANAMNPRIERARQLEEQLLQAKIANVNSDTVRNQAAASEMAKRASALPPGPPALFQKFSDGRGGVVTLPSKDASQAMQNWASVPAQIGVAAGEVGHSLEDAWNAVGAPVWSSVKHGVSSIRGDVLRSMTPSEYMSDQYERR